MKNEGELSNKLTGLIKDGTVLRFSQPTGIYTFQTSSWTSTLEYLKRQLSLSFRLKSVETWELLKEPQVIEKKAFPTIGYVLVTAKAQI